MKNLVAIMLGVFSYLSASGSELKHEASMNFDLENIASFLTELDAKFELGIDAVKLEEFASVEKIVGQFIVSL